MFKFAPFSRKQRQLLNWWTDGSPVRDYDGIIADGSIRAGKTLPMSLSFVFWSMTRFDGQNFAMCGKTIGSFRRNVLPTLKEILPKHGYRVEDRRADNLILISNGQTSNYYYLFGGKDERSQDLIQGITLAGAYFDEVALMPESFVNQATARCSVDGSKWWFNCNPGGPYHWFKTEWIDKAADKHVLHLHFTMDDNLSLSEHIRQRFARQYTGVFYRRYILGEWAVAEGLIYDCFDEAVHVVPDEPREYSKYYISCDFGTYNPTTFGLWGLCEGVWYRIKEYYYSGRDKQRQKTPEQYADDLMAFAGDLPITQVIVDPSAAPLIAAIRQRTPYRVRKANNDVIKGITRVATALSGDKVKICGCCQHSRKEFYTYAWDDKAAQRGEDKPIKTNDHCMDDIRYFVSAVIYAPRL
ncbi:PBSX family phage terminase large subunit [Neobittarella massiliensis]|uniref:PBSX family phage terminase large subunit n=1 Tax=Neobittarella massiliensis (ex Bilen et al. 2018) TaxID=2041842 RepID=A0A8J6IND4_9FIRM|nr:PBSX family phage terminase large subunit [Neobittarella massiliensis]